MIFTFTRFLSLLLLLSWLTPFASAQPQLAGKAIYEKLCLDCHGANGEGVEEEYDDPLVGTRSLEWLAGRIERTMPEDEEHLCVGDDAKAVAAYIYDAFYSPGAQARNRPARVDLTRLTVPQFKTSTMDLVSYFYKGYSPYAVGNDERRGLTAKYFGTRSYRGEKEKNGSDKFERLDPQIKFDFGEGSPDPEKLPQQGFSIRWEGLIIAKETGTYDFIIKTQNGARLWVNELDNERPLIDGFVSQGETIREEKGSVFLQGGRAYAIKLEYFSYKQKTSSINLMWKPPHGVLETIPQRSLAPGWSYQMNTIATDFPADDRSYGYERGSSISRQWLTAVTNASIETADHVILYIDQMLKMNRKTPPEERAKRIREFCYKFAERAVRRPLNDEQRQRLVDRHFTEGIKPDHSLKRVVMSSVTSPEFLYPELAHAGENQRNDSWARASRMALIMWDSLPDHELTEAARKGELATREQLYKQSHRMLWSWMTRQKMSGFFEHWLELDRANDITKDGKTFPGFDPAVMADLRVSLDLFITEVVWNEHHENYKKLLLADFMFLNNRLAEFYGKTAETNSPNFVRASFPQQNRAGVVTHPFLLTAFAYHNNTSPIHRGVFLTRNIVGMSLKPPPNAIEFEDSEFDPNLTMREKVTELTSSKACMACHVTINPLGFSLENYDAIGRWRVKEPKTNKPIDPTGKLNTDEGKTIDLKGARDVAEYAANSPSAHRSFVSQLFKYSVKQAPAAYGSDNIERLRLAFEKKGYNIRDLLIEIAVNTAIENGNTQ